MRAASNLTIPDIDAEMAGAIGCLGEARRTGHSAGKTPALISLYIILAIMQLRLKSLVAGPKARFRGMRTSRGKRPALSDAGRRSTFCCFHRS